MVSALLNSYGAHIGVQHNDIFAHSAHKANVAFEEHLNT